ncbi:type II secretion system F family protein [Vibrio breoganii]|uniref:type II secretion system F family protein n=1 Tax=Vibrio breoganii TaxID=553239 RepID=UPI0002FCD3F6|nr:type II secretion system F family protein [Vibrio breoganii]OED97867.1 biotin synthase [Vibrio breoganii ZF-29]PMK57860.1 biotin synthase [Vibrio breoganii]PML25191.1 biotin synthase [Vibrio breoganii]
MMIIAFFILISALIAFGITRYLDHKATKHHIKSFLDGKKQANFSILHEFLGGMGRGKQREIRNKFEDAGIYNKDLLRYYQPIKFCLLAIASICILLFVHETNDMLVSFMVAIIGVIIVPDSYLALRKKRLIEKNSRQLPYMIDMMAVCVQTGMTLEGAFRYLSDELKSFDKDLCYQIRKTSDAAEVKGMEAALVDLTKRVPTPQVRSFALTLTQNIQYGTSVGPVLSDLAEDFRNEQILVMEEKIGKLAAKMSAPLILFIMFPIVILILAPGITRMMTGN